jgi:hypothetical protein
MSPFSIGKVIFRAAAKRSDLAGIVRKQLTKLLLVKPNSFAIPTLVNGRSFDCDLTKNFEQAFRAVHRIGRASNGVIKSYSKPTARARIRGCLYRVDSDNLIFYFYSTQDMLNRLL